MNVYKDPSEMAFRGKGGLTEIRPRNKINRKIGADHVLSPFLY